MTGSAHAAAPSPAQAPQAPLKLEPLTPVEVPSRPVATVEALPPAQAEAPAEPEETDPIAESFKRFQNLLRPEPKPEADAPRPPATVGQ